MVISTSLPNIGLSCGCISLGNGNMAIVGASCVWDCNAQVCMGSGILGRVVRKFGLNNKKYGYSIFFGVCGLAANGWHVLYSKMKFETCLDNLLLISTNARLKSCQVSKRNT